MRALSFMPPRGAGGSHVRVRHSLLRSVLAAAVVARREASGASWSALLAFTRGSTAARSPETVVDGLTRSRARGDRGRSLRTAPAGRGASRSRLLLLPCRVFPGRDVGFSRTPSSRGRGCPEVRLAARSRRFRQRSSWTRLRLSAPGSSGFRTLQPETAEDTLLVQPWEVDQTQRAPVSGSHLARRRVVATE